MCMYRLFECEQITCILHVFVWQWGYELQSVSQADATVNVCRCTYITPVQPGSSNVHALSKTPLPPAHLLSHPAQLALSSSQKGEGLSLILVAVVVHLKPCQLSSATLSFSLTFQILHYSSLPLISSSTSLSLSLSFSATLSFLPFLSFATLLWRKNWVLKSVGALPEHV